ncbi:uncharacterized protein UTRI_03140_B [Ustilago trichophora]|uniref:RNA-dependent RNA polymerase n=1 Tax=Ustilago trichophora TaxID=86804 RepID=A0A5C3E5U2_9BASI|nr:uncharacterized protein UTRI_03140_B [Ustilago trichophora]
MNQVSVQHSQRTRSKPDNIASTSNAVTRTDRKRPSLNPFTSPAKRSAKVSDSTGPRKLASSAVLRALFESGDELDREKDNLAMSDSETGSDSFYDAQNPDPFDDTPGSSQGTERSTPPSAGITGKAPAWMLFREESPDRIFLPIPKPVRRQATQVKPEPEELDVHTKLAPADSTNDVQANTNAVPSLRAHPGNVAPFIVIETHMRVKIMQSQPDGKLSVPWGVQYYLASLVSFGLFSLDELIFNTGINALRSNSNAESICALFDPTNQDKLWESRTDTAIMARRATDRERQVFAELDREAEIRADSLLNGVIGPPGEEMRSFGGRVLFEGRIMCSPNEERPQIGKRRKHRLFSVQLLPPKLGGSCRFSRRFGSQSILRLKMDIAMARDARRFAVHPKTREVQQEISDFFSQTVHIMGRKYRPFICKDETIFYLWVGSPPNCPDQPDFDCIWDFINHHAPFAQNGRSQLGKFIQRILLGLSTSVPASVIDDIAYEPDIFGDPDAATGKKMEMTDGAASVSLAVARDIAQNLGYDSIPSAFQGRIAGSKGVWYIDPAAERALPGEQAKRWIKIRDSQKKIHYPEGQDLDLSQLVIDLLGPSRLFAPSTLSKQIILVLQSNGVPIGTFADMQRAELQKVADEISNWEGPDASVCMRLATVVERLCKVESLRAKRSTESAEHRAQGMESQIGKNSADSDRALGDDDREIFFGQDGRHIWNGKPLSKHECAYEMLLSGFHPKSCPYLAELLVDIADLAMKRVIKRFAIPVARSAEAMVIPDPTGTLEEGEIQFRFSGDAVLDPDTRLRLRHVPEGEVLVTRHPCLLPTDIRKVRAVVRPELSLYQDVIVFSTKGQRPLASLLSGGDYDGDLIRVFWEPKLVEPFENSDVSYADCPFEISDVFDRSAETVADFVEQHEGKNKEERDRVLIKELVAGAFEPAVRGLYGIMHLYAAWQFGIWSPEAIELAHKFCQCMDSQKTGLTLKARVRIEDSKLYMGDLPEWAYDANDETDPRDWLAMDDGRSTLTARKNKDRPKSVLCALWAEGKAEMGKLKLRLQNETEKLRGVEDTTISGVWKEAEKLGQISAEEREAIRSHVKVMEESFLRTNMSTRQAIEARTREQRRGEPSRKASLKDSAQRSKGMPLRRVRSEAKPALLSRQSVSQRMAGAASSSAVDDLNSSDMLERLDETIEVPAILGSASEVAARFCQWPRAFEKEHIAKKDRYAVHRLAMLRASYAYSITYACRPRFAFEMAWRWIMSIKAEASGDAATTTNGGRRLQEKAQGMGSMQVPYSTLDLLGLRKKLIHRNFEMSQGRGVEI